MVEYVLLCSVCTKRLMVEADDDEAGAHAISEAMVEAGWTDAPIEGYGFAHLNTATKCADCVAGKPVLVSGKGEGD